jgi:threonine dehydrogenase-like Zn-dependent dehydrogenase
MSPTTGTSLSPNKPKTNVMRAAAIVGPREIEVSQIPVPVPASGQVRIRVEGSGVCASNLEVWTGQPWFEYPLEPGAPGHEGWGVVDSIGEDVTDLSIGDRVAFLSGHAYAEYDIAVADQVVSLPDSLRGKPFPGEAIGCAMNIFKRAEIKTGQTVAIVGVGFLGALLIQLAKNAGARVIAISRREFALDVAKHFGAHEIVRMSERSATVDQVSTLTEGKLCDCVIEAVGRQEPLDLAAELCSERGRLVIAGYHQDGARSVNMWLWNWRGLDVINAHERDPQIYVQGMREAVYAVTSGTIDPFPLFTHQFPIDQLGDALDAVNDRPDGFLKALVTL